MIELLVVLVIISILGSVAFRAMDITRERTNYDRTMKAMERLSQAIVGNPTLIAEGHRTDFGFVGDLGRLPGNLDELRTSPANDTSWNGPYVRVPFEGDEVSFKTDAWGREFSYLPEQAAITSLGNGRSPITYRIVEDTTFLFRNRVTGTITDREGNVPGAQAGLIRVSLWVTDPQTGGQIRLDTVPGSDGHYAFDERHFRIPVGSHRMMVKRSSATSESLTKWVSVSPRVGALVDFRMGSTLVGALRLSGTPLADPLGGAVAASVLFNVVNIGSDTIKLGSLTFLGSDPTVYCTKLRLHRTSKWHESGQRAGNGDSMHFWSSPESVSAYSQMQVNLDSFMDSRSDVPILVDMHGKRLQIRFSDGSLMSVQIP